MILIDYSNLANAILHIMKEDVIDEGLFRHHIINSLLTTKIKYGKKYGNLVIAVDSKEYWRKDIFKYYKAHRAKKREESTKDYKHFYNVMNIVINEIKNTFPWKVIKIDKTEADDIIGIAALYTNEPTLIHATDKDFHQCLKNECVAMLNPITKKWVERQTLPEVLFELFEKVARGDEGDGIPNCINTSDAIVEDTKTGRLTTKQILDWYTNGIPSCYSDRFFENKKLIDFTEIPEEYVNQINEALQQPVLGSKGKIFKYLTQTGLLKISSSYLDDIEKF